MMTKSAAYLDYIAQDKKYIWHPFTQHQTERDPIVIQSAKGASLYDVDGNEILDLISSWWTCVHGHSHPEINKALSEQAETLDHVMFGGFSHPPSLELAEKLAEKLPDDLNRVFYSDNGATSVEIALKLSYQYWKNKGDDKRNKFLAFDGSYHGDTVGAMSVGQGCGFFKVYQDILLQVDLMPYAPTWDGDEDVEAREQEALTQIKKHIEAEKENIAALILEPMMQGGGGIRISRPEFIKAVSDLARENNILVIYDEVAVGFGRLGTLFACEQIDFTPDFMCLSKGISGGYMALAATVAREEIFKEFLDKGFGKAFLHGHSYMANPLACAVGLKSLALFDEDNVMGKIAYIETRHREQLDGLQSHPHVFKARVKGTVLAFNLTDDGHQYKADEGEFLRDYYLSHGLNIRPLGQVVYIMPPYCITDAELDRAYEGLFAGLDALMDRNKRAA